MEDAGLKKICIDCRMENHTGIGRYIKEISRALLKKHGTWDYRLIRLGPPHGQIADAEIHSKTEWVKIPIFSIQEQLVLPAISKKFDCFHAPNYNAPILTSRKLVVTIHDLIHLHFPQHLQSNFARLYAALMLPQAVKRADAIISVSEYTKQDLIKTLKVPERKIFVIPHGRSEQFSSRDTTSTKKNTPPFFLYVGLLKTHKNVGTLLAAFEKLKAEIDGPLELKIVGKADVRQKEVRKWISLMDHDHTMTHLENVTDSDLSCLYKNAVALVFPSHYEGFGLPVLEAMSSGCAVIAAKTTSIPELLGEDGGLYFEAFSVAELTGHMKKILQDKDLRCALIERGLMRSTQFTWEDAARKTEHVYRSVLGSV